MSGYANYFKKVKETSQTEKIPNKNQIKNNAGGYVFKVDNLMQIKRFLCLGTINGTYYVNENSLTKENIDLILKYMNNEDDAKMVLELATEYSYSGRIAKNDTAIVVLVCALLSPNKKVRRLVKDYFNKIIRIPTHLFIFVDYLKKSRGFGKLVREIISDWYNSKDYDNLVYHCLKYQQRNKWRHLDVLRLAHVKPKDEKFDNFFGWLAEKKQPYETELLSAFIKLREATTLKEVLNIIKNAPNNLTWEFIPAKWLGYKEVWELLLPNLPFTALLRNLARLSSLGILTEFSNETNFVIDKLTNSELIKKARIHPLHVANALVTYSKGHGLKGKLSWTPVNNILDALDETLIKSFGNVETTNKKYFLALDISESMVWYNINGSVLNCMQGAALMSLATRYAEKYCFTGVFSDYIRPFTFKKNDNFLSLCDRLLRYNFGGTDCALPMIYALENELPIDIFCIYTDNETWYGKIHPCQALEKYRQKTGINAKLAVIGMTATKFSIADDNDPYQLDFVGFDLNTPQAISQFAML